MKSFCPKMGSLSKHIDPATNMRKNRVDQSSRYHIVSLNELKTLPMPQGVLKGLRADWTPEQRETVNKYEGIPVVAQGYFLLTSIRGSVVGAKAQGAESCNCWKTDAKHVDFRVWLIANINEGKASAIVAEITPRVRGRHGQWTLANLTHLAVQRYPIRVYGWLLFEEDEQRAVGITRATLWEIHPVIQIEFKENGAWKTL